MDPTCEQGTVQAVAGFGVAQNMIQDIKESFKDNFPSLKWMDPETRKLAAEKVDSMIDTVGYPEFILHPDELDKAYEKLEFNETDYFQNVMNKIHFDTYVILESMEETPDRTGWSKVPTNLNAYYDVTANLIAFPAAILQPPIYDASFPKSFNFGSIGVFMGHELTHGFDDTGRQIFLFFTSNFEAYSYYTDQIHYD
ncbi:endothelin-converting enzyme homolog [Trichonephila clavipes]|nr:endothelin-converting enzyme homolog [Trichonephila clavipes]